MTERAGLIELHIHDLRHEGISRVAETGQFSLVDLQAFSGHRDTRMLLRYAHLCIRQLADRLDAAFGSAAPHAKLNVMHRGRRRLHAGSGLTLAAIAADIEVSTKSDEVHPSCEPVQPNVVLFRRA
ncbi:hypothetical protein [Burkholderia sp. BCC0322]|uniref:hypothetical protein n=1 Tax=unclassified Burkholderia TaxID=2613784 RepID=UPI00158CC42C|nr:hypothetical protein [Burkholderia sp. BCC0322]